MPSCHSPLRLASELVEIEEAGAGMGIDDAECCRLCTQIVQDAAKHGVFEHVGKIAGMEFVMIIQS